LAEEGVEESAIAEIQRNGFLKRWVEILGDEKYLEERDLLEKVWFLGDLFLWGRG